MSNKVKLWNRLFNTTKGVNIVRNSLFVCIVIILGFFYLGSGPLVIFKSFEGEITNVYGCWESTPRLYGRHARHAHGGSLYYCTYITYKKHSLSIDKNVFIVGEKYKNIDIHKGQYIRGKCNRWFDENKVTQAYIDNELLVDYPYSSEIIGRLLVGSLIICFSALIFLSFYKRRKWPKKKPQTPADIIKDKYARYYKDWNYTVYLWKNIAVISVVFSDMKDAYCRYFSIEKPKDNSDEYYESLADHIRAHVSNYESNEITAI